MRNVFQIAVYLKRVWAGVLFFTLFCSFAFHMVKGERGYIAYKNLSEKQIVKQQEFASLNTERVQLERRVRNMRSQSLDLDLLDQQVREMLYRMDENEYILISQ